MAEYKPLTIEERADLLRRFRQTIHAEAPAAIAIERFNATVAALEAENARLREKAEVRPEVRAFALAMEERLRANDHKGGWRDLAVSYLMARLHEESAELDEVVRLGGSPEQAKHDAADVANFAMMVADGIATLRELVSDQVVTKLPESQ